MALRKPDEIHDRESEWEHLSAFASDPRDGAMLGLVYGRRRQGKSFLLHALAEATGGFLHTALEQDAAYALRSLGEDLGRHLGAPGPVALPSWERAIEALLELPSSSGPNLVVLDELPYLTAASPELPSVIQRALGARSRMRTRLILCGSALSVMGRLLSGTAPLRGRAALDLLVQPFDFRQAAAFWDLEPELAFRLHAILGGTPAYKDLLGGRTPSSVRGFDSWVTRAILDPASPLFREGRYLMAEEPGLTDRALYHSILTAIAEGRTRPGEIAASLERPQGALTYPLNVLEDVRLARREVDPLRKQRPTYRITEPIVRFYFAVMRPHVARLERGETTDVWPSDTSEAFSSQVLGPHLEELAREWTARFAAEETLGGRAGAVGATVLRDRKGRASHEVDVVAVSSRERTARRSVLAIGEAKWSRRPVGVQELYRLEHLRELLLERDDLDASAARILLFSPRFTRDLRDRARRGNVELVDLERLYHGE